MTTHELKCWPEQFQAMAMGLKVHEIRECHDRTFVVGDRLVQREWHSDTKRYSGRVLHQEVTYISPGNSVNMPEWICVMSVRVLAGPSGECVPCHGEGKVFAQGFITTLNCTVCGGSGKNQ